jgi:polyisoprenoid-binding protein YceI
MKKFLFSAFLLLNFVAIFAQKTLTPTDEGSKIHFVIKNFGIGTGGDFSGMKGKIIFDASKPASSSFDVTVDAKTVDTDNGMRDNHLKNSDYFDVDKYPVIRIVSTQIQATNKPNTYMFTGNLTIKGITKQVHFAFIATPKNDGYLFAGDFEINRLDFTVGGGSSVMSDNVKVSINAFAK